LKGEEAGMIKRLLIAAASLALIGAPASGQSLRDLRAQDADEADLAREAAYASKVCGRTISSRIDWQSARGWPAGESLADACDGALGAVETICRAGRKDVVRDFVCAGDGSGAQLSGKSLRYGALPGSNGYAATLATIGAAE
jgi:gas vesicle protein